MVMRGGYSSSPEFKIYMFAIGDPMTVLMKLDDAIDATVRQGPLPIAKEIVRIAKQLVPKDTRTLMNSIDYEQVGKGKYKVFAGAPYGVYVEYGTIKMAAQPFMRPAIQRVNARGILGETIWENKAFEAAMHTPVFRELSGTGLLQSAAIGSGLGLLSGL